MYEGILLLWRALVVVDAWGVPTLGCFGTAVLSRELRTEMENSDETRAVSSWIAASSGFRPTHSKATSWPDRNERLDSKKSLTAA